MPIWKLKRECNACRTAHSSKGSLIRGIDQPPSMCPDFGLVAYRWPRKKRRKDPRCKSDAVLYTERPSLPCMYGTRYLTSSTSRRPRPRERLGRSATERGRVSAWDAAPGASRERDGMPRTRDPWRAVSTAGRPGRPHGAGIGRGRSLFNWSDGPRCETLDRLREWGSGRVRTGGRVELDLPPRAPELAHTAAYWIQR